MCYSIDRYEIERTSEVLVRPSGVFTPVDESTIVKKVRNNCIEPICEHATVDCRAKKFHFHFLRTNSP